MPVPRVPRGSCIDVAARFLAAQDGAVERALAAHHQSADGRCAGCLTRPVAWPCSLAAIAQHARTIGEKRSPG